MALRFLLGLKTIPFYIVLKGQHTTDKANVDLKQNHSHVGASTGFREGKVTCGGDKVSVTSLYEASTIYLPLSQPHKPNPIVVKVYKPIAQGAMAFALPVREITCSTEMVPASEADSPDIPMNQASFKLYTGGPGLLLTGLKSPRPTHSETVTTMSRTVVIRQSVINGIASGLPSIISSKQIEFRAANKKQITEP